MFKLDARAARQHTVERKSNRVARFKCNMCAKRNWHDLVVTGVCSGFHCPGVVPWVTFFVGGGCNDDDEPCYGQATSRPSWSYGVMQ